MKKFSPSFLKKIIFFVFLKDQYRNFLCLANMSLKQKYEGGAIGNERTIPHRDKSLI